MRTRAHTQHILADQCWGSVEQLICSQFKTNNWKVYTTHHNQPPTMDVAKYLRELQQIETEYERNKGSLKAVLDYNPDLDLESGTQRLERWEEDKYKERDTNSCLGTECKLLIWLIAFCLICLLLVGFVIYRMYVTRE